MTTSTSTTPTHNKTHPNETKDLDSLLTRSLQLNTGQWMPQLGLGTWQLQGEDIDQAMLQALKIGYKHFDFAKIYENQSRIGQILQSWFQSNPHLKREDYFFTSKLWNTDHHQVKQALLTTLKELQLEYLDLYLIHWPLPQSNTTSEVPLQVLDPETSLFQTWKAMEQVHQEGLTRAIGVSNFSIAHLTSLLYGKIEPTHNPPFHLNDHETEKEKKEKKLRVNMIPAVNQIEVHPLLPQKELIQFCHSLSMVVTAYCPLGSKHSPLLQDPMLLELAHQLNPTQPTTVANLLLNWGIQQNLVVIPKSSHPERIVSNTLALPPLTSKEFELIKNHIQSHYNPPIQRFCDPREFWGVDLFLEGPLT